MKNIINLKKNTLITSVISIVLLITICLSGCNASDQGLSYSNGTDQNTEDVNSTDNIQSDSVDDQTNTQTDTQTNTDDTTNQNTDSDTSSTTQVVNGNLSIVCFDVGKGDAFLLYTSSGSVLIDTGYDENGSDIGQALKEQYGIDSVDYMIVTHYDKDHVGGADKIMDYVTVKHAVLNAFPKDSDDLTEFDSALTAQNVDLIYPGYAGTKSVTEEPDTDLYQANVYTFTIDQVQYKVYPCLETSYDKDDSNNSSMIISVSYGECNLLFTGDAENERLSEFLSNQESKNYDFIKMPYHGDYFKSLKKLIENAQPEYAVMTSSEERTAADKTVSLLEDNNVTYFDTLNGMIVFQCDGQQITVAE